MAITFVCMQSKREDGTVEMTLFASNEYSPHKDTDSNGKVRLDEEWQHPDPETLSYNELGTLNQSKRVSELLRFVIDFGTDRFGGHVRFIDAIDKAIVQGRLQSWTERAQYDARRDEELSAQQLREWKEQEAKPQPKPRLFEYCPHCGTKTEECQGPLHRGQTRCMTCGGGVADQTNRWCINCLDLPFRERRERISGAPIIYETEAPEE